MASKDAAALCPTQFPPPGFERQIAITVENPAAARGDTFVLATVNTQGPIDAGNMRADGGDIRIATSECTVIPFWIQSGLGTPNTKIWMRMPSVAAGTQQVDLYYGTPGASAASSRDAVFGSNLLSLYTFSETAGTSVADHAGPNTMTMAGSSWATGPLPGIGAVTDFIDGRLHTTGGGPNLGNDFTVLSMIKPNAVSGTTAGIFGNYKDDATSGWSLKLQGTTAGQFMLLTNQNGNWCQDSGGAIIPNTWQLIGARRQFGSTNSNALFQNGSVVRTFCPGDSRNVNGPGPYEIGRQYSGSVSFPGSISVTMLFGRALPDAEVIALDSALRIANPPAVTLVGAPPGAPTIGTASANGTTGSVDFTPPSNVGDGPITRYDVACLPGGQASGTTHPVSVNGLVAAQSHTCAVRAANVFGVGPWSAQSNSFIPGGAPSFGSATEAAFVVRSSGAFTIVTSGQPAPTLDVTGDLPPGLAYADGVIQGTPASGSVGDYPLTLKATNGILPNATQTLLVRVAKATQTITLADLANQTVGSQKIPVSASASSQLVVQLASTTPATCTVSAGEISLVATGVCTVSAAQAGDADFEAAPTVSKSFQIAPLAPPVEGDASVSKPDASISLPPDSGTSPPVLDDAPGADAILGGGCQCDTASGSGSVGGFLASVVGLALGLTRRRRRPL